MKARLAMYKRGKLEAAYPITGPRTTIGRETDNSIQLSHPKVSRHHAAIHFEGEVWEIEDLGSTNGVTLNGSPVTRARLNNRDYIGIGPFQLAFEAISKDADWVPSHDIDISADVRSDTAAFDEGQQAPPTMPGGMS